MGDSSGVVKLTSPINPEDLKNFVKYCSNEDEVIKSVFSEHKIRFTQPAVLNDPLEFNPIIRFRHSAGKYTNYVFDDILFPSEELRVRHRLIERQLNNFGILSLTKTADSFDMWSRYASGHCGFLLEIKVGFNEHTCMLSRDGAKYDVGQVHYVDEYAVNMDDLVNEHGVIPFEVFNKTVFFTKTSRWKEEDEYRMVRRLADHPQWTPLDNKAHRDRGLYLFDFPPECIQSVVFGACMSFDRKKRIMEACRGTAVDFLQAYIVRDQHDRWERPSSMGFVKVNSTSDLLRFGDLGLFFEQDHVGERLRGPVTVTALNQLPYYSDEEKEWIERHYETNKASRKGQSGVI